MNNSTIGKTTLLSFAGFVLFSMVMTGCAATAGNPPSGTTQQPSTLPVQQAATEKPNPQAIGTIVSLNISNRNIKAGDTFDVEVMVDAKVQLRGGQVALTFDPTLMKCNAVSEGSLLKDWAAANGIVTMITPQAVINNDKGTVSDIGISLMGYAGGGGPSKGILASYSFTALKDGSASPKISDASFAILSVKDPMDIVDLPQTDLTIIN